MSPERRAVAAIVTHKGKILVGKKREDSEGTLSGRWHIPGETLRLGEADERGLIRGIVEEAGIEIKPGRYLGSHKTPKGTIVNWYECESLTQNITAGSDLEGIMWVPFGEVAALCHKNAVSLWPREVLEYFQE